MRYILSNIAHGTAPCSYAVEQPVAGRGHARAGGALDCQGRAPEAQVDDAAPAPAPGRTRIWKFGVNRRAAVRTGRDS